MLNDKENNLLDGRLPYLPKWANYEGNSLIKRAGIKIQFTPYQIEEIVKCSTDIKYFASNYVYIVNPDVGKELIKLRDYQEELLDHLYNNRFSIIMATRQSGKSLSVAIYLLHYILFNHDKRAVILANKLKISKEIFNKIRVAFERLPFWLQDGVVEWQKTSCALENGSSCSAEATTAEGMRGITANIVALDEFAFVPRNIADEFFTAMYPTISASKKSKLMIISTPNGLNHFHTLWKKAVKGQNEFAHFKVSWDRVPGRDDEWKRQTIKNIGETKFKQEYEIQFLGSTYTLVNSSALDLLEAKTPIDVIDNNFYIYKHPEPGHTYVIGVDSAKGTGYDFSVCQVLDITNKDRIEQVAVYSNNTIDTHNFGKKCVEIGTKYNEAYLIIENNAEGNAVINSIWVNEEYENIVDFDTSKKSLGVRATKKTKNRALDTLKVLLESEKLILNDQDTIYQMSKFSEVKVGVFKGEDGEHDDLVSGLYWATFFINLEEYYDEEEVSYTLDSYLADKGELNPDLVEEPLQIYSSEDEDSINFTKELLY